MDICEVSPKLHYVAELLNDLWHYHQASAHTCPCTVCTQKQSLIRSIITKALQEVAFITNCIESFSNCENKNMYPNDLTVPLKYLCKTAELPEQENKSTVLKGNPPKLRQHSSELEINCSSDTLSSNIKEHRKYSVCSDSGLNTSFSSHSLSPVLNEKYQQQDINNSQLQVSDTVNEISDCVMMKDNQSAQNINSIDKSLNRGQLSSNKHFSKIGLIQSPTKYMLTLQGTSSDSQGHLINRSNLSNSQLKSLQDHNSDLCTANITLPALTPQNLMLLPLSEKLEKHGRYSEQLLRSLDIQVADNTNERYQSFSQHLQSAQKTQLTSTQSFDASVYLHTTPAVVHAEENIIISDLTKDTTNVIVDQICPERECTQKCCTIVNDKNHYNPKKQTTCLSNSPFQNGQPFSEINKNIDYSTLLLSDCHSDLDKTSENLKEGFSRQQLNVQNIQFESHRKDLSQPESFLRPPDHHSLHAVSLQIQGPGQSTAAWQNDELPSDSCNDEHKLTSHNSSQQDHNFSISNEIHQNSNMQDDSAFDSMWRPWETYKIDEGQEDCKENHDLPVNLSPCRGLLIVQNDITKFSEATVKNDINMKVIDCSRSDSLMTGTFCSELNSTNPCLKVKVTEQNYRTIDQKDRGRSMIKESGCSSLDNNSITQKMIKLSSEDNLKGTLDKNIEKTSSFIQPGREQWDVSDTGSTYDCKASGTDVESKMTFEEELPTTSDRSLKCLSNILHSSRKNISTSTYENSTTHSPRVSCSSMNHDKENDHVKCSQKSDDHKSSTLSIMCKAEVASIEQPLLQKKHVLSHDKLPDYTSENISNESNLVAQPCSDNCAIMLPHSQLILANSINSLVRQPANDSSELLPPPAAINLNMVVSDDSSRTLNSSPTSNKHLQWGAPAIVFESSSTPEHLKKNVVDFNNLKTVPKLQPTEQYKSISNRSAVTNSVPLNNKVSSNLDTTFVKEDSSKWGKVIQCSEVGKTEKSIQITHKGTTVKQEGRVNLSQTLPVCKLHEDVEKNKPKLMNASYEANQSFPKLTKSQQLVPGVRTDQTIASTCGQAIVTDLQLTPECLPKPAPRNRRSIFGCSPPDSLRNQKPQEPDTRVKEQIEKCHFKIKPLSDPNESSLLNLWSVLDASDDIGRGPSVQEVLFNCVTSSLCVVDPDRNGKIISVNESFQFLIGVHEKVVGQRFCRFIKFKNSGNILGESLPQSFILSDGHITIVKGKLACCINASGESIPVSVWTVPFKPQPKLTMCVIGVSLSMQAEIYLSHTGNVLMYSEPFEDILGLTMQGEKAVCQIPDLDFSQIEKPQHTSLQALDGCSVPVTVTITGNNDASLDTDTIGLVNDNSNIYPATMSIFMNVSGLLIVGSNGIIQFCDKNYFRINLGHCYLEGKRPVSELLSEITKVSQGSSQSSPGSSPDLQDKLNSTSSDIALVDVSRLHTGDSSNARNEDVKESAELFLPQSCFSSRGLVDMYDLLMDGSDEEGSRSICTESFMEETEKLACLTLSTPGGVPYQTSTPCKNGEQPPHGQTKEVLLENGIYAALFLHGNGSHIPVTFKLSRVQTSSQALFCLWIYIQPGGCKEHADSCDDDDDADSDYDVAAQKESEAEDTCDEEDIRNRLKNLHFDHSGRAGDVSSGQLLMEQAGLNQSHNATSGADLLDLEVAVEGSFGQKYMVYEALGQGSFGFVRRAKLFSSADTVVVKFIKKSKMFDDAWFVDVNNKGKKIPLEVAILRKVSSDHIIKILDVHENATFVQMVMEDFGETDLFDFIDQVDIDEPLACYLFRQILWAVDYLHSRKIIHRDIKDENVIISRSFHCKLIDFGSATYMLPEDQLFTKFRGTMEYCSPEVYNGAPYRGPELDAWALGVTLYTILFRENPFTATEVPGELDDLPHPVTQDVLNLMLGLLDPDPRKRVTVRQTLSCDWLRQIVDLNTYSWHELFGDVPLESKSMIDIEADY